MSEVLLSKQDLAIAQVASTDATRQQLQAIAVRNIGGNKMRLAATDGYIAVRKTVEGDLGDFSIYAPSALATAKIMSQKDRLVMSDDGHCLSKEGLTAPAPIVRRDAAEGVPFPHESMDRTFAEFDAVDDGQRIRLNKMLLIRLLKAIPGDGVYITVLKDEMGQIRTIAPVRIQSDLDDTGAVIMPMKH